MAITTYSELQTAIADFLNRDDLTSAIPTFISLAEAQIARDLRHWKQEKRAVTTVDERYENLPNDWIELKHVLLTDGGIIETVSLADMAAMRASSSNTGKPKYMTMNADQLEFYPTPDAGYEVTIVYYGRIPALSDADPDNWLLLDAPDVLLYGALVHSAPYLADDPRIQVWSALYQASISGLLLESQKADFAGPLRIRIK